jgi:hypothetical protein
MPPADRNYTFYQIPVPRAYRRLSRRKRIAIELIVGVAVLILFAIGTSVQMPLWLQIAGWALFIVYWVGWSVVALPKWWRRARARSVRR